MNLFDGLYGYEKLMLICGLILFVFALAAITAMIVQRRDFKMAMALIVLAIVLMGFPGIQAVKISQGIIEIDRLRTQSTAQVDPQQQQQAAQTLSMLEQRAAGNPLLQAKVADGYRAIGEVDKGYQLAQAVLQQHPSAQARATLVPVLTAKLNQVQAGTLAAAQPAPATGAVGALAGGTIGAAASGHAAAPPPTVVAASPAQQRQIAAVARQLQDTGTPLPAASHIALAKAYVVLDQPQQARSNVEAALKVNPQLKINPALSRAIRARSATAGEH